jgi:hypothetical protein
MGFISLVVRKSYIIYTPLIDILIIADNGKVFKDINAHKWFKNPTKKSPPESGDLKIFTPFCGALRFWDRI